MSAKGNLCCVCTVKKLQGYEFFVKIKNFTKPTPHWYGFSFYNKVKF